MYQLVYVSEETRPFSDDDLVELLKTSRRNNIQVDVTGILLYKNGRFVQVLEGPEEAVRSVFDIIKADERHTNISVAIEQSVDEREFGEWEMGFARVADAAQDGVEGVSNFMEGDATSEEVHAQKTKVLSFLKMFQQFM